MLVVATVLLLLRHYHIWLGSGDTVGLNDRLPIMISAVKISYVALNYLDATKVATKTDQLLTPRERLYAEPLAKVPTYFEWSAYFYFVGSVNIGMPVEYKDFTDFINLRGVYGKMRPGTQVWHALKRCSHFVLLTFSVSQLTKHGLVPSNLYEPSFVNETIWYKYVALIGGVHVR